MDFSFSVNDTQTGASSIIVNSEGARGLQLLLVIGPAGDDANTINASVIALSENEQASQEAFRSEGFPVENTGILLLYPGISEHSSDDGIQHTRSVVLPARFQVQISSAMGLGITATIYGTLLP